MSWATYGKSRSQSTLRYDEKSKSEISHRKVKEGFAAPTVSVIGTYPNEDHAYTWAMMGVGEDGYFHQVQFDKEAAAKGETVEYTVVKVSREDCSAHEYNLILANKIIDSPRALQDGQTMRIKMELEGWADYPRFVEFRISKQNMYTSSLSINGWITDPDEDSDAAQAHTPRLKVDFKDSGYNCYVAVDYSQTDDLGLCILRGMMRDMDDKIEGSRKPFKFPDNIKHRITHT